MKALTIMVTEKTARQIDRLAQTGKCSDPEAYALALMSHKMRGDRWVKVGEMGDWWRLPKRLSCGR